MNLLTIPIEWHDCVYWLPVGFYPMATVDYSGKIEPAMKSKAKISPSAAAEAAAVASPSPVFPVVIRQRGVKAAPPKAKAVKRDNIFSKSRDTREDRGERQMKTSNNAQTMPHGR